MALALTPTEILEKGEHCLLTAGPHWERVPLSYVADVQNGAAFKSEYFTHGDGLPLIRIRDVGKTETDNHYNGPYEEEYLVYPGDIIIGMDGDFRAAKWEGDVGLLNQRVCRLKIKSQDIDHDFLLYCLQPFLDAINEETSSVTVKHLSSRTVAEIPLPLPPLNEQRRIVAKIEELFSELDKGVESLKTARAQLKTYRQSLLKAAFEGRLTEQWRRDNADKIETADQLLERIQEEREARYQQKLEKWNAAVAGWGMDRKLGKRPRKPAPPVIPNDPDSLPNGELSKLPSGWRWLRVGDLFPVYVGATPSRREPLYWGGSINWVSSGEVAFCEIWDTKEKITSEGLDNTSTIVHPEGTVVLAMIGEGKTRGQAAILRVSAAHNQNTAAIRVSEIGLDPAYLFYFFMYRYEETRMVGSGNNQKALNKSRVQAMPVPLAPESEQRVITKIIEQGLSFVSHMEEELDEQIQRADTLRQSILKRAFEGKLVPQDPDDEPASALLERIRQEQADAPRLKRRIRKTEASA
ncbi:restriction endonuclease subunit S [Thioalkalivibrio sp.]|uniref:restriction endonuclease subunit S n=1 Tax=Thioalkalivibrio sp. TaxID=2093813 RepID=UPI0035664936